jgi:hypothetical protein
MNKKILLFFLLALLTPAWTLFLPGCSQDHSAAYEKAFAEGGKARADSGSSEPVELSEISFSAQNLPRLFEIIVGGKCLKASAYSGSNEPDGAAASIRLSEVLGENAFLPDGFWLISPFFEPQEFFFRDFDLSQPIDLGALALTMKEKKITARPVSEAIRQIGPFICGRDDNNDGSSLYDWASAEALWCYSRPQGVKLIGLDSPEDLPQPIFNFHNETSFTVAPDGLKVAYIEQGYLVVHDLQTAQRQKWPLTRNPAEQTLATCSTELLSWSPNGRFILGSNFAYYNHYLAKLWALDLQTGRINAFNARLTHSFADPVWSPDGNQVVVTEIFKPFSTDFRGQWDLLDLRSPKIFAVARKEKFSTSYDFSWNSAGKLVLNPSLAEEIEVFDPLWQQEQEEFRAYRLDSGAGYLATGLRFLTKEGETEFTLDLKPALVKCGLELETIHTLFFDLLKVEDKYLFLKGKAATLNNVRAYALFGRVDLTTKEVVFLEPLWVRPESRAIFLGEHFNSAQEQLLLLPDEDSLLILDLAALAWQKITVAEPVLSAGWVGEKILYITASGIYLRAGNSTQILHKAQDNEAFLPGIKLSPDLSYAVIPSKKPYTGMLDEIGLTIIDLKALREFNL